MTPSRSLRFGGLTLAGIGALLGLMGCLAYPTGESHRSGVADFSRTPAKPFSAYIETQCVSRNFLQNEFFEDVDGAQYLRFLVSSVEATNRFFTQYTFTASRAAQMDYRLVLSLSTEERGSLAGVACSALTLTVIPATCEMRYILKANLFDASGVLVHEDRLESSMRVWIELLLFPLGSWRSPDKVKPQLLTQMVEAALSRIVFENRGDAPTPLIKP